jgi:hypothetical protein
MSGERSGKLTTFSESTFGKSSGFEYKSRQLWVWSLEMVWGGGGNTCEQGESKRGEVRKQMDVPLQDLCLFPLTHPLSTLVYILVLYHISLSDVPSSIQTSLHLLHYVNNQ